MRVTILTLGSRGDVQPFVALGLGLTRAGHEVRLATHPKHAELVEGRLAFAPLAEGRLSRGAATREGRDWIERGSRWQPTWVGFVRDARSVARERLADAAAACHDADAIVASNLATLLGWHLAEHLGVPLVRAHLNPPAWMSRPLARAAVPAVRQLAWLAARPWLAGVRRDVLDGAAALPLRDPVAALDRRGAPLLYAVSPAVFPTPPGAAVTGFWILDDGVDPDPPPALREFLAAGPPPVCVGFGTQIDRDPGATTRLVVAALRRAGARGVLIRDRDALGDIALPPDVVAVGAVAHEWLFPRCAAVVHHAAAGTTAAALRAGVPSVPVPHMTDQFTWARRLRELGVSPAPIARRALAVEPLADAIRLATGDAGLRRRAAELGARVRAEDGVARAVEAFERHAAGPVTLSSGLRVHGASKADARHEHFVHDYFRPDLDLRPGMTVLDVGANIGLFSLELLRRCGGEVRLLAFEPAERPFAHLERNVRQLFPRARAHLDRRALGARPGEAAFYYRPRAPVLSSLYRDHGSGADLGEAFLREPPPGRPDHLPAWFRRLPSGVAKLLWRLAARWVTAAVVETRCAITTVSEVIAEHALERVDFLKIDVEGAELDVLRGIDRDDWPRIGRIAVEVHDVDGRVAAIRRLLEGAGFDVEVEQDWPFDGSDVHMVHAARATAPTTGAVSTCAESSSSR